jgi:Phosphotransferase enzyme family
MNRLPDACGRPVSTAELRAALETVLGRHVGGQRHIAKLTRRPSDYSSSFALDELDVLLDDGAVLELVFKNVSWEALLGDARRAKPPFLYNPLREIEIYETVLASEPLGTATFYGSVVDQELGHYWLFLERVPGLRLCHVGEFDTWKQVARYLALMHNSFARHTQVIAQAGPGRWVNYDRVFYWQWLRRAQTFVRTNKSFHQGEDWRGIERVAGRYDEVIDRLLAVPQTLIHGEFYASNVLVDQAEGRLRICPVDWEMAAVAPGIMDLAALTCGTWSDEEKRTLALAYHDTLEPNGWRPSGLSSLLAVLDLCQLHLAVQWLGWSLDWSPPPEQARDWLSEALRLTEKLGL